MIIACRIGYLMRLGRTCPDMDCEIVFDWEEWQAAWLVAGKPLPPAPPNLNEAIRVIARGFLGRKGDEGKKSLARLATHYGLRHGYSGYEIGVGICSFTLFNLAY